MARTTMAVLTMKTARTTPVVDATTSHDEEGEDNNSKEDDGKDNDGKDDDKDNDSKDSNNTWRGAGRGMIKYFLILGGD